MKIDPVIRDLKANNLSEVMRRTNLCASVCHDACRMVNSTIVSATDDYVSSVARTLRKLSRNPRV